MTIGRSHPGLVYSIVDCAISSGLYPDGISFSTVKGYILINLFSVIYYYNDVIIEYYNKIITNLV